MTTRLKNETDEEIVIPPGESIDIKALKDSTRTTVARLTVYKIQETEPASSGIKKE